jgi:opacity protein-like surface antigen
MLKRCAIVAALVTVLAPASARADWLFTPNIGMTFGGAADGREHLTYGASLGWMGAGIFGFEADFQYTPEFFEGNDDDIDLFDSSNVLTVMGNAIFGVPIGGQTGAGIRPFGVVGVGLLQTNLTTVDDAFEIDSSEFGFNLGAGVMGFASDRVGFRGDIRYIRSFDDLDGVVVGDDGVAGISAGDFDFWRANFGVILRW